jgi:hypothetical protein
MNFQAGNGGYILLQSSFVVVVDTNSNRENLDDPEFQELLELHKKQEKKKKEQKKKKKKKIERKKKEKREEKKRRRRRKEKEKEKEKKKKKNKNKNANAPKRTGRPCDKVPGFINFRKNSHSWLRCENNKCNREYDRRSFNPNHQCII